MQAMQARPFRSSPPPDQPRRPARPGAGAAGCRPEPQRPANLRALSERTRAASERERTSKRLRRIALPSDPAMPIRLDRASWRSTPYPGHSDPTELMTTLGPDGKPIDAQVETSESRAPWHLIGSKGPLTGEVLGEFELGGVLGTGGLGVLYRARERSFGSRVALRTMPFDLGRDPALRAVFATEVRVASELTSQHLVRIVGAGGHAGCVYLATEFIEATDLGTLMEQARARGETFGPSRSCDLALQVFDALAEAGEHALAHLDLRPSNLLVNGQGLLRVAGFGLSCLCLAREAAFTGAATVGSAPDISRDLYAVGVHLHQLLTGVPHHDGLLYPTQEERRARPLVAGAALRALPSGFHVLLARLLHVEARQGYADCRELIADLERCRSSLLEPWPTPAAAPGETTEAAGLSPMEQLPPTAAEGHAPADDEAGELIDEEALPPAPLSAEAMPHGVGGPPPSSGHSPRTMLLTAAALVAGTICWLLAVHAADARRSETELAHLRQALAPLDQAVPLPAQAAEDIARMAQLEGADDPEVVRLRTKLETCARLRKALAGIDQGAGMGPAALASAGADLHAYAELVGGQGEEFTRWSLALERAQSRNEHLLRRLAVLDQDGLPLADMDALVGDLAALEAMAGVQDPSAVRWRARILAAHQRAVRLHQDLHGMDAVPGALSQDLLRRLSSELSEYLALLGAGADADADVARWRGRLHEEGAHLAELRQSLARLDQGAHATLPLAHGLEPALARVRPSGGTCGRRPHALVSADR